MNKTKQIPNDHFLNYSFYNKRGFLKSKSENIIYPQIVTKSDEFCYQFALECLVLGIVPCFLGEYELFHKTGFCLSANQFSVVATEVAGGLPACGDRV